MLKRIAAIVLVILSLSLQSCVSATAGLQSYSDNYEGYQFLYPSGWIEAKVNDGPEVVLHDLIEETENLSVVINEVPEGKTLAELGTPTEVGYKLSKAIAPPGSSRTAELVNAEAREVGDQTYYLMEYEVQLPNQARHNLASAVVRRGKLFTLNLSTTEQRWQKVQDKFRTVVTSFSVY